MTVSEENAKGEALIAQEEHIGTRLDAFIASFMPSYVSRSRVTEIIKQGGVTVNDKETKKPNHRLKLDDKVIMEVPEPEEAEPEPENIPLDIYYEDDHLLIINKPAGMVVHPAPGNWSGTIRPGIVHRLDKDTSGLLVVAKNELNAPLARSPNNRKKRAVVKDDHTEAKEAITHFTVKAEYGMDEDGFPICSLVECRLQKQREKLLQTSNAKPYTQPY